jgi:hypothetical protein
MKKTIIMHLMFLTLTTYLFLGCVKQDKVNSVKAMKTTKVAPKTITSAEYGQHTDEIQEFLSATPLGSEIYLEQQESGEWYLKVEKTFTAKKHKEKTEMIQPIYGESILI